MPLQHLHELIERVSAGYEFQFVFDPDARTWRGTISDASSGAVYNTSVYIRWHITLVLDLVHARCSYDAYFYDDTST